jgi:hypothetical protein
MLAAGDLAVPRRLEHVGYQSGGKEKETDPGYGMQSSSSLHCTQPSYCAEVYNSTSNGTVNFGLIVMEMTMPQQYIDFSFVKANASFEAVLAHYNLTATGSGKDRAVLCPFHEERKAS